jgi:exodeoxyribonuclease V gamma subunit
VDKHPLRRFDDAYWEVAIKRPRKAASEPTDVAGEPGGSRPSKVNFSAAARKERQARRLRESLAERSKQSLSMNRDFLRQLGSELANWLGLCPIEGSSTVAKGRDALPIPISMTDIRRFLECPLQGWARVMLRLREEDDEEETQREDEHFATGRLRETGLLRNVFLAGLQANGQGSSPEAFESLYAERAKLLARQGLLPVGLFGEVEKRRHIACLAGWQEWVEQKDLLRFRPFEVYRFGRAAESERVEQVKLAIPLEVKLPGDAAPRRVELYGRTEIVSDKLPGSLTPVARPKEKAKDFLRGFLDAVVLSLIPDRQPAAEFHARVIPLPSDRKEPKTVRTFRKIDAAGAHRFLTTVLADLLGEPHDYLLPCEAVFAYLEKGRSIEESVEEMKEDDRKPCSSRYGPVPDFERYNPPDKDEAQAMIERRFGLFRECGGMAE